MGLLACHLTLDFSLTKWRTGQQCLAGLFKGTLDHLREARGLGPAHWTGCCCSVIGRDKKRKKPTRPQLTAEQALGSQPDSLTQFTIRLSMVRAEMETKGMGGAAGGSRQHFQLCLGNLHLSCLGLIPWSVKGGEQGAEGPPRVVPKGTMVVRL